MKVEEDKESARTYDEGSSDGQTWARSLTVSLLCRISLWSITVNFMKRKDRPSRSVLGAWLFVHRGGKASHIFYDGFAEKVDYAWSDPDEFWRAAEFAEDLINVASRAYYEGYYDGAVAVARRVYSNSTW